MDNTNMNEIIEDEQSQAAPAKTPEMLLPQQYQPKPLFELTKSDTAFAGGALIASIFSSVFGIFGGFAFGYMLSICFMMVLFGVYFIRDNKVSISALLYGMLALANSTVFICTTNGSVRFFGVIISFLLSLVFFDGIINKSACGNRQTLGIFYCGASTMGNIGVSLKSLFTSGNGDKKTVGKALVGLLCAVPVLIIVVPLLIKSDDAFSGMMSSIFSGSGNAFVTVLKAVFGAIISIFVISYGFSLKYNRISKTKESKFEGIENVYLISFLSAIAVCYLLYLFSQLAYFFSAFKGFLPNDKITYSEYARKGFFEMCIIAVINLGLVFFAMLLAKKQNGKVCHGIKAIATFIAAFTLIIIATAISKMVLYINEFGMTVLRIGTSAFMVFLSVVFIAVILRIYINKINIVKTALITAGISVLLLGTVNINALCARYNYQGYKDGRLNTIDIETLYNLGDEGIPYVVRLACSDNKEDAYEAQKYLAEAYLYDYFDDMQYALNFTIDDLRDRQMDKGFERFSIPKATAYDELYKFIESNPQFAQKCHTYLEDSDYDSFW